MKTFYFQILFIVIALVFVVSKIADYDLISDICRSIFNLFLITFYVVKIKKKSKWFLGFLVVALIAELINVYNYNSNSITIYYFCCVLFIISYLVLIVFIVRQLNFKKVIKDFKLQLFFLTALTVFTLYSFQGFILEVAAYGSIEYFIENAYYLVLIILFNLAFINYLERSYKKEFLLFLAVLFIFLSEFVQTSVIFIKPIKSLDIVFSILLLVGYYFIFKYLIVLYSNAKLDVIK